MIHAIETTGHIENQNCLMLDENLPLKPGKVKIMVFLPEETAISDLAVRKESLLKIAYHCGSLPVLDDRSPEKILGYDEQGLPG